MKNAITIMHNILVALATLLFLAGCSGSSGNNATSDSETGAITAKLVWDDAKTTAKTVALAPTGVKTVRFVISGSGMTTIQQDFDALAGTGTISGVIAGTGRTFTALGLNSSGTVTHQVTVSNITVQVGQTTDVGTITMLPLPSQETLIDSTTGMVLVKVTGGTFTMGDIYNDGYSEEKPTHQVTVSDFYIGKYEVTQAEWQSVMGSNPSGFTACGANCPVEQVSWNDVQTFITTLNQRSGKNYRLPTEAEWEYAARSGGKSEKYSGGSDVIAVAWYGDNSGNTTHPVGQKQSNGLGLYDMSGNVWEWVSDWYGAYSSAAQTNPTGPTLDLTTRVIRGGSWNFSAYNNRTFVRGETTPGNRGNFMGLRLAAPASAVVAPTAPSGLSAVAVSSSQINLSWTDTAANETGFKIERKTGSGGTYTQIGTATANATSYTNTSLTASTAYYYRVRANNSVGDSGYSNEANATTSAGSVNTGPTITDPTTGMVLVKVTGGTYTMGDTIGDGYGEEQPTHQVTLSDFYIGKYEVTQAEWQAVMGWNGSNFTDCGTNCPVELVSWNDVQTFITTLNQRSGKNYRLPTEAEWEYAARSGGQSQKYSGGSDVNAVAWYIDNSGGTTHTVGQKQANGLGLYDMSGNVWEWVSDWFVAYSSAAQTNPTGPTSGSYRVFRGGGWISFASDVRASRRYADDSPDYRDPHLGFRLAAPVQ